MAPEQEDRGVAPKGEEIILNGEEVETEEFHVQDALGNPAAPEDDLAGD